MRFALVGRCVCVVALGLRTASANARVTPFGRGVRAHWFDSRTRPALSSEEDMGLPFLEMRDPRNAPLGWRGDRVTARIYQPRDGSIE